MSIEEKPLGKIEHPKDLDSKSQQRLHWFEFTINLIKLIIGLSMICAGVYLIIKGFTGDTSLKMEMSNWKIDINTSVIGIVCFLLGVVICCFSRLDVKVNN